MRKKIAAFGRRTFSALKRRNFRLYFAGQAVSLAGTWMQSVAQSWLVLQLTGSGTALGIVAAFQYGPTLLLAPYAGVLADRLSKRRILFFTQALSGVIALVLGLAVVLGFVTPALVYVMAIGLGFVTAFDHPTRQSFLFELAGPRDLLSAVGLSGMASNVARVIGPAIAGVVIAVVGMAPCFFFNAATAVVSVACLYGIRTAELIRTAPKASGSPLDVSRSSGQLKQGIAYAIKTPVVCAAILMMAVAGTFTYEFGVTLPMLAKYALGGNAGALAWLMCSMGAGAALGGLVTAGRRGEGLPSLIGTVLAFGMATALVGVAPTLLLACVVMFVTGIFAARFTGLSNGIVQLSSAPEMRNRMVALWSTAFLGSTFVGGPLIGWIGENAGVRWAFAFGALGGILAAGIGWYGVRHGKDKGTQELRAALGQGLTGPLHL